MAEHLLVPDGPAAGAPMVLTGDQAEVLFEWFRVDEFGLPVYRRGCWRAPQGCGKSPLLAVIALAELCGPSRCDGFDGKGRPVAVPPPSAYVQCAAVSADQSANVFRAAFLMAAESDLAGELLDVGLTRIHRTDGRGVLEPVTASAGSRLGQRLTFAVCDESHLWTRQNGGDRLADVLRRNAAKMAGRTFEVSNAPALGEGSVVEATAQAAQNGAEGLLYVSREAPPVDDLTDFAAVRAALEVAYGDAATGRGGWVHLDRIARDAGDPGADPDTVRRYFFNQATSGGLTPVDIATWKTRESLGRVVEAGERIALGFDGSISDDETVVYGCTEDGHLFLVGAWSRPPGAPTTWRIPRDEVNAKVDETFDRFDVGRLYADTPKWREEIGAWVDEYNTRGVERVLALDTYSVRRFAPLCDSFVTAIDEGRLSHDGDEALTRALAACARKQVRLADDPDDGRARFVIVKADTRKIDRAVAAILAYGAATEMPAAPRPIEESVW